MNPPAIRYLFAFLIILAGIAYGYGIAEACIVSWPKVVIQAKMPEFLTNVVTTLATVLATNLGAVLGITFTNSSSPLRNSKNWNPLNVFSENSPTVLQTAACYIYVVGLLAAAVTWAHKDFSPNPVDTVRLIPDLTKSLLGIIAGALVVALNIPKKDAG